MPTRNLTILMTDLKGFTARTSTESREGFVQMMAEHDRLLVPVIRYFDGVVVKTIGDAFLVRFESPTDAVLCGLTIQEVLRQHNSFVDDAHKLEVRVAINCGEVEMKDNDVLGEPVNLTARLEAITEAGEVYFTEAVHLAMKRSEVPSSQIGEHTFKGIPYAVRVYKVTRDPKSPQMQRMSEAVRLTKEGPVIRGLRQAPRRPWLVRGVAIGALVIILLVGFFLGMPSLRVQRTLGQARKLIANGQGRVAFDLLQADLDKNPDQPRLREMAVQAAETYVDSLIHDGNKQGAYDWLAQAVGQKPYLEPLRRRLPALEADATISALAASVGDSSKLWSKVDERKTKYPQDPDVLYVMAEAVRHAKLVKNSIHLYKLALQNGHAADAPAFEACTEMFARNYGGFIAEAQEVATKYFPEKRVQWARKALVDGTAKSSAEHTVYIVLNAWDILQATNDPLIQDPFYKSLHDVALVMRGGEKAPSLAELDESCMILAKSADVEHARRAMVVLGDTYFTVPDNVKRRFQGVLDGLKERWPGK